MNIVYVTGVLWTVQQIDQQNPGFAPVEPEANPAEDDDQSTRYIDLGGIITLFKSNDIIVVMEMSTRNILDLDQKVACVPLEEEYHLQDREGANCKHR